MSKLIKNTSFYALGNLLPQAAAFFLLPVYTKHLTPDDYGIVSSMQALSGVLAIVFTMAIERSVFRLYFDYKTDESKKDFLGTITITLFTIALIVLGLLFTLQGLLNQVFQSIPFYPFYAYAIFTSFLTVFSILPKVYLQLNQKAEKFVLISIIQFFISTGFVLWFIVVGNQGAEGMLKGRMIGELMLAPLFSFIIVKNVNFKFRKDVFKESILFSLPMVPGLLSAWIMNLSDRIFIERYFDLYDVGIYSLGYKIAGLTLIVSNAFYMAYSPVFYRLANAEDQSKSKALLSRYNRTYTFMVLLIVFLISFFSKEVIELLIEPQYLEAHKIVPIVAFAYLISQASSLFNLMIYQEKKVKQLVLIGILGAVLNLLLNWLLVPMFGPYGAAYATIITFSVTYVSLWSYATKCYYIPVAWKELVIYALGGFTIILIFSQFDLNIQTSIPLKLSVVVVLLLSLGKKYYLQLKSIWLLRNKS